MTPTVELLVQDLQYEYEDIEEILPTDYERVLATYKSLINRCLNLKEEHFPDKENYDRIMGTIKMIYNGDSGLLTALEHKLDYVSALNFKETRQTLSALIVVLKSNW